MEIVEDLENKDSEEKDNWCSFIKENSSYEEAISNKRHESQSCSTTGPLCKYSYNGFYISPSKSYVENGSCNLLDMSNNQDDFDSKEHFFKSEYEWTTKLTGEVNWLVSWMS